MSSVPENLPGAILEETFFVDEIVAVPQEDGSVHLLMYVGRVDSAGKPGYVALKYAVIHQEHAAGLFGASDAPHQIPIESFPQFEAEAPPIGGGAAERHNRFDPLEQEQQPPPPGHSPTSLPDGARAPILDLENDGLLTKF